MRPLRVSVRVSIWLLLLAPTVGRSANAEQPDQWIATEVNPPALRCREPVSECTAFAADELQHYLTRILGTPVTEETRDEHTPVIQLSIDAAAAGNNDEAYTLRAEDTSQDSRREYATFRSDPV